MNPHTAETIKLFQQKYGQGTFTSNSSTSHAGQEASGYKQEQWLINSVARALEASKTCDLASKNSPDKCERLAANA
jgi:hypothetical protein